MRAAGEATAAEEAAGEAMAAERAGASRAAVGEGPAAAVSTAAAVVHRAAAPAPFRLVEAVTVWICRADVPPAARVGRAIRGRLARAAGRKTSTDGTAREDRSGLPIAEASIRRAIKVRR